MRKALLAVLAAAAMAGSLIGPLSRPAAAAEEDPVPTIADLAISISDSPDPVSPVGGTPAVGPASRGVVVYKVTATNDGLLSFPVHIEDSTLRGTYRADASQIPGCLTAGGHNPTVTCDVTVAPGMPFTFYVGIEIDASVATVQNTATIDFAPEVFNVVDPDSNNNQDAETTTVSAQSATYLRQGESTTFQSHKLTVTQSGTGIITRLTQAPAGGSMCGTKACKQGLRVLFFETDRYFGRTEVDLNFGTTHPCTGQSMATCKPMYYRKPAGQGPAIAMPKCATAADSLCWDRIYSYNDGCSNFWHLVVRLDTDDPDLLEPVKSLTSGTNG